MLYSLNAVLKNRFGGESCNRKSAEAADRKFAGDGNIGNGDQHNLI